MSRHVRCLYGGKYYYPSLQCFIVAPSASGKGILSYLRLLVQPIHDEIRAKVAAQMKIYKKKSRIRRDGKRAVENGSPANAP